MLEEVARSKQMKTDMIDAEACSTILNFILIHYFADVNLGYGGDERYWDKVWLMAGKAEVDAMQVVPEKTGTTHSIGEKIPGQKCARRGPGYQTRHLGASI